MLHHSISFYPLAAIPIFIIVQSSYSHPVDIKLSRVYSAGLEKVLLHGYNVARKFSVWQKVLIQNSHTRGQKYTYQKERKEKFRNFLLIKNSFCICEAHLIIAAN
ncbi:MAG: hypothetical protein MJA29_01890, partial [Candidatus Omnitrophica bacterium]|nr:hypothetical protein [Candidatus Omnitrophota bacterium]